MPLTLKTLTSPTYYSPIAHVRTLAFSTSALNNCVYGSVSPAAVEAWNLQRAKRDASNPASRTIAVMDGENVVAYAVWEVPLALSSEIPGEMEHAVESVGVGDGVEVPEGSNEELFAEFKSKIEVMRGRHSNAREEFSLHVLAVHPDYQCRGCGAMLVKWGTEKADAAGRKSYLESSPAANRLYRKYGWVEVDEMVIGLKKYEEEDHRMSVMKREPSSEVGE